MRPVSRILLLLALLANGGTLRAQSTGGREPVLVGYYAGDGTDLHGRRFDQLTHVIWCFGHLRNDSFIVADKQVKVLRDLVGMKRRHPRLKVLVSLGGWGGCADCSEVFAREEGRRTFARTVKALLKRTWADGIDLDWEYPAVQGYPGHAYGDGDRHHFTLLVRALREELGPAYEITFAAGGTDECLQQGFEWDSVMAVVDRVHVMSYDLVHGYSTRTGHHTPLYPVPGQQLSADRAVQLLTGLGVARDRIVIGSAFYGRVWKDVPPQNNGLFQPGTFSHAVPHRAMDTTITAAKGWVLLRDEAAAAPYGHHAGRREFITYDDAASVTAKARYVREQGLGGIMFWQLRDDAVRDGLLDAIHRALRAP